MKTKLSVLILLLLLDGGLVFGQRSEQQLARWLKQYPEADANGDGRLTVEEAEAYRRNRPKPPRRNLDQEGPRIDSGAPPEPKIDPGWQRDRFPEHAVGYRHPNSSRATSSSADRRIIPAANWIASSEGSPGRP